jgi:SHS2 domain-containing protein
LIISARAASFARELPAISKAAPPGIPLRGMEAHYELFDHTADLGVRVRAASFEEMVAHAAEAFYATIGELTPSGIGEERQLKFQADDRATLLRDFLTELLHIFETKHQMVSNIVVIEFTERKLDLVAEARIIDNEKSQLLREVKAVTYHELALKQAPTGWELTFIVDI